MSLFKLVSKLLMPFLLATTPLTSSKATTENVENFNNVNTIVLSSANNNEKTKKSTESKQLDHYLGFGGGLNNLGGFYKNKNLLIAGSLNDQEQQFNGKFVGNRYLGWLGIKPILKLDRGSEKQLYKSTSSSEENSAERAIKETAISDQITKTGTQAIGFGLDGLTFTAEYVDRSNNTDDQSTIKSRFEESYGNDNSIIVNNKTNLDLSEKVKSRALRIGGGIYNSSSINEGICITGNAYVDWGHKETSGIVETLTEIINNSDTTEHYNASSINNKTKRTIWTLKPAVEKLQENLYAWLEVPLHFKDYKAVEVNSGICGFYNKLKNWTASAFFSGNYNERKGYLKTNIAHSHKQNQKNLFNISKKIIKDFWYQDASLLSSDEEKEIIEKTDANKYAQNLHGIGVEIGAKLEKSEKPGYELGITGSKNGYFGCINASTQNFSNINNNYEISATCGLGNFSIGGSYGKVSYDPCYGVNVLVGN